MTRRLQRRCVQEKKSVCHVPAWNICSFFECAILVLFAWKAGFGKGLRGRTDRLVLQLPVSKTSYATAECSSGIQHPLQTSNSMSYGYFATRITPSSTQLYIEAMKSVRNETLTGEKCGIYLFCNPAALASATFTCSIDIMFTSRSRKLRGTCTRVTSCALGRYGWS